MGGLLPSIIISKTIITTAVVPKKKKKPPPFKTIFSAGSKIQCFSLLRFFQLKLKHHLHHLGQSVLYAFTNVKFAIDSMRRTKMCLLLLLCFFYLYAPTGNCTKVVLDVESDKYKKYESTKWYSQHGQDEFIMSNIFNHRRHGYFVELGAANGVLLSNTLTLEESFNWTGICIEPSSRWQNIDSSNILIYFSLFKLFSSFHLYIRCVK